MYRLFVLLAVPSLAASAQSADHLFAKAKAAMQERLSNTPDYSCVLEIDRLVFPPDSRARFKSKDVSRLEIAVVDGNELFGWPGEASTETALDRPLGSGLFSTGEFSVHGRATFLDDRSTIERLPADRQIEASRVGFSYRVPLDASQYVIAAEKTGILIPYQGEFWVDSESGQLLELSISIPKAPEQSALRSIRSSVKYIPHEVHGKLAWLPSEARIEAEAASGDLFQNSMRFMHCRAFQSESTITFGEGPAEGAVGSQGLRKVSIPDGLVLLVELTTPIESAKARAGDRFDARVLRGVRYEGEVLLPKDAVVRGRLREVMTLDRSWMFQRRHPQLVTSLVLELLDVRWAGYCGGISATLDLVESAPLMARTDPSGRMHLPRGFAQSNLAISFESSRSMSAKGLGAFNVVGEMFAIRRGARMRWKTEEPPLGTCN